MTNAECLIQICGGSYLGACWLCVILVTGLADFSFGFYLALRWLCVDLPHKMRYARFRRKRRGTVSVTPPPPPPSSN